MESFYGSAPEIIKLGFINGSNVYSFYMHEAAFKEFLLCSSLNAMQREAKTGVEINPATEILTGLKLIK